MKILVLDDDPTSAIDLPKNFEGNGDFDLVLAATSEDARFSLQHESFDGVLIALRSSRDEWFDFCREVTNSYPSLWMGLIGDPSMRSEFQDIGKNATWGWFEKPITPESLRVTLQKVAGDHSVSQENSLHGDGENKQSGDESHDLRSEAMAEQILGKMVGPFQIHKKLAQDNWGILYEAIHVAVDRLVALKILDPRLYEDSTYVHHFISFASAMARAQNPYITTVYEAGEGNGLIFYAREYVDGTNLYEQIEGGKILSEEDILQVIISIGEALNYEKENGILHAPLFPEQVLLPSTGIPKLLNNVTTEGSEMSAGEMDEIQRLGNMLCRVMGVNSTLELNALIQKMEQASQGGFTSWGEVLHEFRQLELARHAKQAVHRVSKPAEMQEKIDPWKKQVTTGVGLVVIVGCFFLWYFRPDHPTAKDLGKMVKVPAGSFIYQAGEKRSLPSFYIDKYEVTIGQYRKFLEAWKKNPAAIKAHPNQRPGKDYTPTDWNLIQNAIQQKSDFKGVRIYNETPVFNVDFFDAWAYAQWSGKRLPKEQEWEKAARGPEGNLYPWGNTFNPKKANTGIDLRQDVSDSEFGKIDGFGLWSPVGAKKRDRSVYGVMDTAGNVSEWTDSLDAYPGFNNEQVPVVRGGSWASKDVPLTKREPMPDLRRSLYIGFRCVSDSPPSS